MSLLTTPRRPIQPRRYKQRQVVQQDSQSTLREEPEEHLYDPDDQFDEPLAPPKLNIAIYDEKELPMIPRASTSMSYVPTGHATFHRPPTPPSKPSTSNRWKSAVGKLFMLRRSTQKPRRLTPSPRPPLSPASSRQPSFYTPQSDRNGSRIPHRSAVTLLTSASSTQHGHDGYNDYDTASNPGMSRNGSLRSNPVTPLTIRGNHMDHLEPIAAVLQRADRTPPPVTPIIYSPITPIVNDSSSRAYDNNNTSTITVSQPTRTPSPPPFTWPASQFYVANPSPSPTPTMSSITSSRSSPVVPTAPKRARTTMAPPTNAGPTGRNRSKSFDTLGSATTVITGEPRKRPGPRIIQPHLPHPIPPDPKQHVFTGPWYNRRGDEWLGISAVPGEYRMKAATEANAFDVKYINHPEGEHLFMNNMGDVINAKTLAMVSKAARV
ncbi:hypothetical protein FRC17_007450 [Serendipita sp. 399]|nr:hypothetical protein FRC17_007450 [Serendipita sp. 399]